MVDWRPSETHANDRKALACLPLAQRARSTRQGDQRGLTYNQDTQVWNDPEKMALRLQAAGVPAFKLVVDVPDVGSGIVDTCRSRQRLCDEWWGGPANDEKRFANQRTAAYWYFRTLLESDQAVVPNHPALEEEALAMLLNRDGEI